MSPRRRPLSVRFSFFYLSPFLRGHRVHSASFLPHERPITLHTDHHVLVSVTAIVHLRCVGVCVVYYEAVTHEHTWSSGNSVGESSWRRKQRQPAPRFDRGASPYRHSASGRSTAQSDCTT